MSGIDHKNSHYSPNESTVEDPQPYEDNSSQIIDAIQNQKNK